MATSGKITGTTKNSSGTTLSYYGTWVDWKVNSTNVANNTKNITIDVKVQRTDGTSGTTAYNLYDKPTVSLKVGGSAKTPTINYLDTRNLKVCTLATWTGNVTHNSDGTLTLPIVVSWTVPNLTYLASGSISGNASLDRIPRATKPTLSSSSVTMGSSITVTISPADTSFKHKIRYEFGSLVSQIDGVKVGGTQITSDYISSGTVTFTPPTSLGSQIPNANSGTCKFLLYTYTSSGSHIGTESINITVSVPSYTPTISNIALTGNNLLSSAYVQGKSTVSATVTASSSYGATIQSYSSTVDGKTYTGSSFTSSALSNGSKTVAVTVTDTRGKTATLNSSAITVYAYANPSISSFTVERQEDGTTVIATVKGTISAINNKNAKTITVTLNGVTQTITSSSYTINGTTTFTGISTDNTFTATAKLQDSYTSVTKDATLPTVAVTMDFHNSGKGVALGKVAEEADLFEVAWKTKLNKATEIKDNNLATLTLKRNHTYNGAAIKFQNDTDVLGYVGMYGNAVDRPLRRWTSDTGESYIILDTGNITGTIKDYVIEQGTSGGWEYTKWNNGKIEMFGDKSLSFPAGTKITDNLYRSIVSVDLSSYLTKIVSGNCPIQSSGMIPQVCRNSSKLSTAEIVISTSRTIDAFTLTTPIYIIGKWK